MQGGKALEFAEQVLSRSSGNRSGCHGCGGDRAGLGNGEHLGLLGKHLLLSGLLCRGMLIRGFDIDSIAGSRCRARNDSGAGSSSQKGWTSIASAKNHGVLLE